MNDTIKRLNQEINQLKSELARLQEELAQAKQSSAALVNSIEDILFYKDRNGVYLGCNPACARFIGIEMKQIMGKTDFDLFPREEAEYYRAKDLQVLEDREAQVFEEWVPLADGQKRLVETRKSPMLNSAGEVIGIIGMSRDITERKKAEQALQESNERYKRLSEATFEGIALTKEGKILDVNQQILDIYGYTHNEFIKAGLQKLVHPDDLEKVLTNIKNNVTTPYELRGLRKDGAIIYLEVRASTITIEDKPYRLTVIRDITERKKTEEQLKLTQFGIEHTQIGIYRVDDNGDILYANEQACKSLGYSPEELLKLKVWEFDATLGMETWNQHRKKTRLRGATTIETIHRRKDGTEFPVEVTINFIEFEDKKLSFSFVKDITERKQAEQALRAAEQKIRDIVEHSTNLFYSHTSDHVLTYISPQSKHFLGCDPEEAKIKWTEFVTGNPLNQKGFELTQRAIDTARVQPPYRLELKTKDGRSIWVEVHEAPIVEKGRTTAIVGALTDITDRVHAEQALLESEEKYRSLIDHSADAIYLIYKGRFELINKKFQEMFGLTSADINKPDFNFMNLVAPKNRSLIEKRRKLRNQKETLESSYEFTALTAGGQEIEVEAAESQIKYKEGFALQGILRDVTERKQMETQLRQAQKMEAVGQLAGGVAHDFNNLLTVINGYCDLLLLQDLNPELQGHVEQIQQAGVRAMRLTSQLLAFSRKQMIKPKILNLNTLISDNLKMLGRLLGEDIAITTQLQPNLGFIKADPGQVDQIIMNISINARDAMPFGGKLIIETANVEFDADYIKNHAGTQPGLFVMLAISDTGVGMNETTRAHIFEPFFTTKGRDKGTGLGLATVYGIVKQNKGFIYVYSEPQKGSTFKIYLPLAEASEKSAKKLPDFQANLMGNKTILLVEDDAGVREVTRSTLAGYGYSVLTAANGKEAIRLYRKNKGAIDLLLTDVIMPMMSGRELAEKLLAENPALKILYFSGYTDNSIVHHGVLEDGIEFIQKPYSHIDLAKKLREVLGKA